MCSNEGPVIAVTRHRKSEKIFSEGCRIRILNPNPSADDFFGRSVASIGDDAFVVAAFSDDSGASNAGAAYVFDSNTGQLLHTLLNPEPNVNDFFGASVGSIGNDIVAVGSGRIDEAGFDAGSVYLFSALTGALLDRIDNPDPSNSGSFGEALSSNGPALVIGAPFGEGQAYVLAIPEPTLISFDIKPGSDPNSVNLKSKGVLPEVHQAVVADVLISIAQRAQASGAVVDE